MSKIVCVYHNIDLDGFMSAAIVKHWFLKQNTNGLSNYFIYNRDKENNPFYNRSAETLDFIGYNYGQPIPDLSEYDKVIMCDISFPKEEMYKLWHIIDKKVIWLDHHISAINDNNNLVWNVKEHGLQDTKYSACELTWKYFFPNEPMPEIVRLLGRYDCFGHKTKSFEMSSDGYDKAKQYLKEVGQLKEFEDNHTSIDGYSLVHYANDIAKQLSEEQKVLEFQYGARQYINNIDDAYDCLRNELLYNKAIDKENLVNQRVEIWNSGISIYKYLCIEAKQSYKNGFNLYFNNINKKVICTDCFRNNMDISCIDEYDINKINSKQILNSAKCPNKECKYTILKFICINKERFNPINFGIDYHKDGYDGAACFHYANGMYNFSLYNDNGLVDCSVIAKQFGGGGHKGAAGFTLNKDNFNKLISN